MNKYSMKRLLSVLFITTALILLPVGCTTPQRAAYTETKQQPKTVEQALKEWNTYIETHPGKVTLQMNNAVRDIFLKWKQLTLNVIDIGSQMSNAKTNSVPKADLEVALHSQMAEASKASADLINLINTYSK